jgi:hypothetical protein
MLFAKHEARRIAMLWNYLKAALADTVKAIRYE